jgi:hypothetical protein
MPMALSDASVYEAIQIDDQLVLTATRQSGEPGDILFFQQRPSSEGPPEFALLKDQISVTPQAPPSGLYAFKGIMAKGQVSHVRIYEKGGTYRDIPVKQRQAEETGTTFTLPVIDISSSLDEAVAAMRESDARAIVTRSPGNHFQLFTNFDIARAYENDLTLKDINDRGHVVTAWPETIPAMRTRLFSMVRPRNQRLIAVTSLFETIGNGVAHGSKICRCSSNAKNHTVMDGNPSLDGTPCVRPLPGHGIYQCF